MGDLEHKVFLSILYLRCGVVLVGPDHMGLFLSILYLRCQTFFDRDYDGVKVLVSFNSLFEMLTKLSTYRRPRP